ncbi:MAG: hypothetical protein U9O96_08645, partial [Candidatus Thermoplasmatota archaeon]|nr:hypothetical protein [Candidatus Thermoplasmatota archaeon]
MEYDKIVYYGFGKSDKDRITNKFKTILMTEKKIKTAYVFGSFTRRDRIRDIDIAIYAIPQLNFEELLRLGVIFELEVGIAVDLVQLQYLDPFFKLKVLRKGLPLIKNDLHHYLVAQTYSECLDFNISLE